jgi:hypothetical protein
MCAEIFPNIAKTSCDSGSTHSSSTPHEDHPPFKKLSMVRRALLAGKMKRLNSFPEWKLSA